MGIDKVELNQKTSECACNVPIPCTSPSTGAFIVLLITLWALNIADVFQTLYLKESGLLEKEANYFIDFFLREGRLAFFGVKFLALVLITSMLIRGWIYTGGTKLLGILYNQNQLRCALYFMLTVGIIYYTIIVILPFSAMLLTGFFST